jgi:NAD(P)-dependent dehydrogenase (short-subunit alcohol dehydrogenase family)
LAAQQQFGLDGEMAEQRVVLVTGASSGIGRATAGLLARSGYRVYGTSRKPQADTLDGFMLLPLDVTDDASVAQCMQTIIAQTGRLDVLVSNAGATLPGAVEMVDVEAVQTLFETNYIGTVRVIRAALPHLRASRGKIIIVGSGLGLAGMPFQAHYSASKHALEGLAEALRQEVAPLGVRVSIVEPGFVQSGIYDASPPSPSALSAYSQSQTRALTAFERRIRRGIPPDTVASTIHHIVAVSTPRLRYTVGHDAQALAWGKRLAPYPLFVKGFRLVFGLDWWRDEVRRFLPFAALAGGMLALWRWRR